MRIPRSGCSIRRQVDRENQSAGERLHCVLIQSFNGEEKAERIALDAMCLNPKVILLRIKTSLSITTAVLGFDRAFPKLIVTNSI